MHSQRPPTCNQQNDQAMQIHPNMYTTVNCSWSTDVTAFATGHARMCDRTVLTHCGRVTQICVFTLQLCRTGDADLRL